MYVRQSPNTISYEVNVPQLLKHLNRINANTNKGKKLLVRCDPFLSWLFEESLERSSLFLYFKQIERFAELFTENQYRGKGFMMNQPHVREQIKEYLPIIKDYLVKKLLAGQYQFNNWAEFEKEHILRRKLLSNKVVNYCKPVAHYEYPIDTIFDKNLPEMYLRAAIPSDVFDCVNNDKLLLAVQEFCDLSGDMDYRLFVAKDDKLQQQLMKLFNNKSNLLFK